MDILEIKVIGIVISQVPIRERDLLITILLDNGSKITANAAYARSKKSKTASACQLFCYAEFILSEKNGKYFVAETTLKENFFNIGRDVEKLALSSYFLELINIFSESDIPLPELTRLLLNALFVLAYLKKPDLLVKFAFEVKLMALTGYMMEANSQWIQYINEQDCKKIFSPDIPESELKKLAAETEHTLVSHIGTRPKTLLFHTSIKI